MMELLPKEIIEKIPKLYETEETEDPIVQVKFFLPGSRWTYYVTEYDPEERIVFGYCISPLGSDCDEWGYTCMSEIESLATDLVIANEDKSEVLVFRNGCTVERDLSWEPKKFSEIKGD